MQSGDPDECSPPGVASFHLVREPLWRAPVALARLGTDLLRLRGTPGLRFARLLGTGRGATAMGADLARTAIFAVWDDPAALAAFEVGAHRGGPAARAEQPGEAQARGATHPQQVRAEPGERDRRPPQRLANQVKRRHSRRRALVGGAGLHAPILSVVCAGRATVPVLPAPERGR